MGVANYDIVPVGKLWGVQHDGKVNGKYSTKESAFERQRRPLPWRSTRAMRCISACRASRKAGPLRKPFDAMSPLP